MAGFLVQSARELATLGPLGTLSQVGSVTWAERAWHDHPSERSEQNRPDSLPHRDPPSARETTTIGAVRGLQTGAPNARDGASSGAPSSHAGKRPQRAAGTQVPQQVDFGDLHSAGPFSADGGGACSLTLASGRPAGSNPAGAGFDSSTGC